MIIGCLTGNRRGAPIGGSYEFCAPGLMVPLAPDLGADRVANRGIRFAEGVLTDGDAATGIGWRGATVGEAGVDVAVRLEGRCFVDQVVVRSMDSGDARKAQVGPPGADGIEAVGHVEPEGLSCVEVYASIPGAQGMGLVGRAGQRGDAVLPESPVRVEVGVEAEELVVRLISCNRDIRVGELEVWGAGLEEPALFPVPARMEALEGEPFVLESGSAVLVGAEASADTLFAARLLAEKVEETLGWSVPVVREGEEEAAGGAVLVGRPGESSALEAAVLAIPEKEEGYALKVESGEAAVLANDRRGLVYGVESLLQLLVAGGRAAISPCLIEDAPRLPFRGVHLFLPARDQLDYAKRLIRNLLVPMKLNTIFLELAGGMRFERRPEIAEVWEEKNRMAAEGKGPPVPHGGVCGGGWITRDQVRELVEYAREYGIEVIPEIQSLSHVQYLTMTYPEIAERPVEDGYADSYCPLHPKSHEIVFDLIDEVVEVFGPLRYVHMGHDEVYTMAECPRCRGKSRDELFAHDVEAIHGYLREKGIGMMIWADMLQPWQRYAGERAATLIPRDIVMLEFVWYFRTWADTEDLLLENGFRVIFGNCYSSHFTRYEKRTAKAGVIGTQVSVWSETSEEEMGRLGKIYDLLYSANGSWSACCQEELRRTFDRKIAELLPGMRARLRGAPKISASDSFAIDLQDRFTAPRRDATGARGGYDYGGLPAGEAALRGIRFRFGDGLVLVESGRIRGRTCPERVEVPVGARVAGLVFAHGCTGIGPIDPFGPREPVGYYEISYADGGSERVTVAAGHHVAEWNRRHGAPLAHRFHRHAGYVATYPVDPLWQGKTAQGEDATLYGLEWTNPHPEREVRSIGIAAAAARTHGSLLVAGIAAVKGQV